MSISQTYYIDGLSLETSTAVYTNSEMSLYAPDGYYSDGSISRQQVSGTLLAVQQCVSCLTECGISFSSNPTPRVSLINVNVLSNIGPIIIRFNPVLLASGILVEYDGNFYNKLSSPTYGLLAGSPSNKETYIGQAITSCTLPVVPDSVILPIYKYLGGVFQDTGSNETISINPFQVATTATSPGECIMVIPKPNTSPSDLKIKIVSTCSPNSNFELTVDCPTSLPSFNSTTAYPSTSSSGFCTDPLDYTFYFASQTYSETLGLYDWVFSTPDAQNVLADGWYRISPLPLPNNAIHVVGGVVVQITFVSC